MPKKAKGTAKKATKKVSKKTTKKTTTKKVAKKTSVKKTAKVTQKTTAKKAAAKKDAAKKKKLKKARGATCFWTRDGLILENLVTLGSAFKNMSDEEFYHHVTKDKNDFADWVEQILEDAECASALRKTRKPNTAATVVVRHLKYYDV